MASVMWNIPPWQGGTGERDSASDPLLPFSPQTYFWALGVKASHPVPPSIPKCQSNARETRREPISSSASCQNSLRLSRAFNQCKRSQHVHGTKEPGPLMCGNDGAALTTAWYVWWRIKKHLFTHYRQRHLSNASLSQWWETVRMGTSGTAGLLIINY